jgi:hypothetical protein
MDIEYGGAEPFEDAENPEKISLLAQSTVLSINHSGLATIDPGCKGFQSTGACRRALTILRRRT